MKEQTHKAVISTFFEEELGSKLRSPAERKRFAGMLADQVEAVSEAVPPRGDREQSQSVRTPAERLTTEMVLDAIGPTVRELRQHLFRTDEAPFRPEAYAEAAHWIEEEHARTRQPVTAEDAQRLEVLRVEIEERLREYSGITGGDDRVSHDTVALAYWTLNSGSDRVLQRSELELGRGQPVLHRLAADSARLANATGFSQPGVVAYVLAGLPPVLKPWTFRRQQRFHRLTGGKWLHRTTATIEIDDFSSPNREKALRWWLKRLNGEESAKERTKRAFLVLLRRVGPVPQNPPLSFWRDRVLPEWIGAGMKKSTTPAALQKRWYDLPEEDRTELSA